MIFIDVIMILDKPKQNENQAEEIESNSQLEQKDDTESICCCNNAHVKQNVLTCQKRKRSDFLPCNYNRK